MASTYTTNLGIEKPGTGEQSGTWGDTANTNYDLIDQAINGIVQVTLAAAGSSGSPNSLAITNGTASDGRNKYIEFIDGGDLGATAYVQLDPNDAEKIVHMRNSLSGSRSVIVFQGTYNASNDFEIPAGKDVVLKFDGAGAGATVTQVFVDLKLDALDAATVAATTGNITTVNATTVDTTNLEVTNIKAKDGTSAGSIADSTGVVTFASAVLTTADINGGTMDGVTIGGASTAAGSFTTVTASGRVTFGELKGTGATVVSTILDEDNMASNSATALATQQSIKAYVDTAVQAQDTLAEILANGNTTGANNIVVTSGQVITTDTINETSAGAGVNIDSVVLKDGDVNATIGATTAKAANFTTMGASSNVTVGGTLGVTGAATLSSSLSVNTGAVFNEGGGDNDFRVESDTKTHALFVDGDNTNDRLKLGIGTGTITNPYSQNNFTDLNLDGVWGGVISFKLGGTELGWIGQRNSGNGDLIVAASSGQSLFLASNGNTSRIELTDAGNVVVNPTGADNDFRVESDTNTHALFVDAGTSRIGINTSAPDAMLHLDGVTPYIRISRTGVPTWEIRNNIHATGYGLSIYDVDNSAQRFAVNVAEVVVNEDSNDYDFRVESDSNTHMLFVDAGNNRVGIGASSTSGMLTIGNDNATRAYSDRVRTEWNSIFGVTENTHYQRFKLTADSIRVSAYVKVTVQPRSPGGISSMSGATLEGVIWRADGGALFDLTLINNAAWGSGGVSLSEPVASGNDIIFGIVVGNNGTGSTYDVACKVELIGNTDDAFTYSEIAGTTAATGTNPGQGHFFYYNSSQLLGIDSGGTVVNEASADRDFRVESDAGTYALFVEGSSGNIGINEPTPNAPLHIDKSTTNTAHQIWQQARTRASGNYTGLEFRDSSNETNANIVVQQGASGNNAAQMEFYVNAGTGGAGLRNGREVLTLYPTNAVFNEDSNDLDFRVESNNYTHAFFVEGSNGRVNIGDATVPAAALYISTDANLTEPLGINDSGASGATQKHRISIKYQTTEVGSIKANNSATTFNTSSDARLKENIADADDAGELIDAIQVRQFNWIVDGAHQRYGMVAQELITVAPEAVSEGETEEEMMGVDYSKLVPMLIKEIQSLRARVHALESK